MYLLELKGMRFLLECGLYQGKREESIERNRTFPFDPQTVDAVVLSHEHDDHFDIPSLATLDRLAARTVAISLPPLTLGIATNSASLRSEDGMAAID